MFEFNIFCKQAVTTGLLAFCCSTLVAEERSPLGLRDAVSTTLKTNPLVLSELREVDARDREVRAALGSYYPSVDILAGYGFQERDPSALGRRNELDRSEVQLNARQLVFDGFRTNNEYKLQKSRLLSARHTANSVGEDVGLDVIRTFLSVMREESILSLAEETLATHQEIYEKMSKRHESGIGSRADFDQISGRLALAKTNVFNATANLIDAKTNFQRVVGHLPETGELGDPGSYRKYLPPSIEDAVYRAVQNHPLIKTANEDVNAIGFQYQQTKADFYPQFHVAVERDLNRNIDGLEGQVDDLRVMLQMRYNLYRGRSDQAKRQQFAHLVQKAREIKRNTHREVEQETRLAWTAYHTLSQQIPSLKSHYRDSKATRDAYIKQFDLGRRTLLDLLNTENEMVDAQRALFNAQYDKLFNEYRIFHAMGDLLYMLDIEISE